MLIILDNAESIFDPQGANAREIYGVVEELSRFGNICLVITSRITSIPPNCETLQIPKLSMGAAQDTFYDIYRHGRRSDSVNSILKQLDFHPLSVTLLATVAHQNQWGNDRLVREWKQRRTGVLRTEHQTSLATAIELSLASPLFRALGLDARGLLGVVAFYPQGVNENNLNLLFPTIPSVPQIFDRFCILSLTYRSNGFITMLAPLRDHLRPKDPRSSPLLRMTKDRYFAWMSVEIDPNRPDFKDGRWIASEDVNVEHLLNVFTSVGPDSSDTWKACINFIRHLQWYKPRQTVLRQKIETLPDNHRSKPACLFEIAALLGRVGNYAEETRLLSHVLRLERWRRNDSRVALTLRSLSRANRTLGFRTEGISQAKEALKIYTRLGDTVELARCLNQLAWLLHDDRQLDAAEGAAIRSIQLLQGKGQEYGVCLSHCTLGNIYRSKGEREKAIHHLKAALAIASPFNWHNPLFSTHLSLAELFLAKWEFDGAHVHMEQAKSHALDNPYFLGRAVLLQARILYPQGRLGEAMSEVLRALEIFQMFGASKDLENCRALLRNIEQASESGVAFSGPGPSGELLEGSLRTTFVDSPFSGTAHRHDPNRISVRASSSQIQCFSPTFAERILYPIG